MRRPALLPAGVLVAGVLVAGLLAGCGGPGTGGAPARAAGPPEPADPPAAGAPPGLTLAVVATRGNDDLALDWVLGGDPAAGDLLVVRGLPVGFGAATTYDTAQAWVTGDVREGAPPGRVLVSQRVFPEPDGAPPAADPESLRVAVEVLPAGAGASGRVVVPLPLVRRQPFGDDLGAGPIALPDPAGDVVLCLGVVAPPYPAALELRGEDGVTTVVHGDGANAAQHLVCAAPVPLG